MSPSRTLRSIVPDLLISLLAIPVQAQNARCKQTTALFREMVAMERAGVFTTL